MDIPIKKAVDAWFAEKKNFDKVSKSDKDEKISSFKFISYPVIGHYSQLVWAQTYKVSIIINT